MCEICSDGTIGWNIVNGVNVNMISNWLLFDILSTVNEYSEQR